MQFLAMEKKEEGHFITRYDLHYQAKDGRMKTYEIVSRRKDLQSFEDLQNSPADAVVMILHSPDRQKLLLNKEFRMAAGVWIYSFPAGIIDPGETPEQAAVRELREETGLTLETIEEVLPVSYNAIGFSNEKNIFITGTASGDIRPSDSSFEEIEAAWVTRQEARQLMKTEHFAGRSQLYCYLWCREEV